MWCKSQIAIVLLLFFFCDAFAQPRFKGRKVIAKHQQPAVLQYVEPRAGAPQTVTAQCTDSEVIVTISPDLLGIQKPVQPSDLSMGGCGVTSPAGAQPFVIEAPLQGCGSTVEMLGALIVYTFTLDYNPSPIDGLSIVRTNPAVVQIECQYNRLHNVSSNALNPTWVPYTSTISAEDILGFSLVIMSSDWSGPSPSNTFFLGDLINLQASVDSTNHVPLRIFVDRCVATPGSNASAPAYTFIGNNGCFLDSKLIGSNSQFVSPRVAQSVMQFQLDAFRFYGLTTSSIFITCHVKVTLASANVDPLNKDCSYNSALSQWSSVDGNNAVCSCCDTSCANPPPFRRGSGAPKHRPRRASEWSAPAEWQETISVGPLFLEQVSPLSSVSHSLSVQQDKASPGYQFQYSILGGVVGVLAVSCLAVLFFAYRKANDTSNKQIL
ncbi:zona pellucida sperm-binding protein 3-like isoform X5 [Erpetoichthys calabaricus]|uniref:zona pellucida sperm-binding protein 3-like isoform X5 n=1 Tax=Erpetoichthys calabaricus TaxID=27687 RepID=UPI002234E212|nr:zona pellucida sperm-binding protein 3-like isoform X5 [Erpetoichthys calabaricus]